MEDGRAAQSLENETLRYPGVPSMFDSLEVKVLYPT
jgi:hypothetical protein